MPPRVEVLADLPKCDVALSYGMVAMKGPDAFVVYEIQAKRNPPRCAVVCFHQWELFDKGPNDHAQHNHPLRGLGLQPYRLQEIVDSPLVRERVRMHHEDGVHVPGMFDQGRHFVLNFHDNSIECIAAGYELVGTFMSAEEARAAIERFETRRRPEPP
jgi:hypothetical protein